MTESRYPDYEKLYAEGLISDDSLKKIKQCQLHPLFTVHWEIKTILYLGIILFTGGVGVLVYKNIDTIGHQFILLLIALVSGGCLTYCFKYKKPFSRAKVQSPNTFFDYVLLLGAITLLIFVGYLQYQYNVFGNNYGLATFIPMLALFYMAYSFDHAGILNMAIVNLGLWLGVTATPQHLLDAGTFNNQGIIYTYLGFGVLSLASAWLTQKYIFKKHFKFSYEHYGIHMCMVALLAGYFSNYDGGTSILWLMMLLALAAAIFQDAYKEKSFYFLLLTVLYGYVTISIIAVRLIIVTQDAIILLGPMYFIGSSVCLIMFLINLNKKIKTV